MDVYEPYEGQRFSSFEVLKKYLEEYGKRNYVKYWIRSSHTINSLKSKSKRFNPALKYACMKFACIFGGEKTRCRGSGIRRSSTYRNLGCPFTISAVIGEDGNHVKLENVILEHNHSLGKSLYDSLKKSKNKMKILQDEIDNRNPAGRVHPRASSLRRMRGATTRRERVTFSHLEILRPQGSRKGLIRTDSAEAAKLASSETFQVCLREMQEKYGPNIKILIVNREEAEEQQEEPQEEWQEEPGEESQEESQEEREEEPQEESQEESQEEWQEEHEEEPEEEWQEEPQEERRPCQEINEIQLSQLRREFEESERIRNSRFSQICRLCLSSTNELHPIFDPSQPVESTIRSFKIMSCASIDVSKDDGLPGNICTACEEQLDLAYNFRIRSENADTSLRQSNPVNEYVNANEIPLLTAEDLQEIEPSEQEEVQGVVVDPEEQTFTDSSLFTQDNIVHLDPTKNIFYDEEHGVYAKIEDSCPICSHKFDTYANMIQHLEGHKDVGTFLLSCNFCSEIFSTIKALVSHLNDHMAMKAAKCVLNQNPENRTVRMDHETNIETQEANKQPVIPESEPVETADTGYLCSVCGKILKSKYRFQSHKNTHEGLRPHKCTKCGRGFADRKNMHQHYDIVHLKKAKHECPICHKMFYAPTKMKSHITMHYGLKPFSCDICNKTFRLRMNMIKHKKTHSNERPHKCDKCKAAFIDKNLLTRHSYVHGGIRPHVCAECGHRFTLKFNLKKHLTSGRCSGRVGADGFAWETVTATGSSTAGRADDDVEAQKELVDELLQQLGAK